MGTKNSFIIRSKKMQKSAMLLLLVVAMSMCSNVHVRHSLKKKFLSKKPPQACVDWANASASLCSLCSTYVYRDFWTDTDFYVYYNRVEDCLTRRDGDSTFTAER